MTDKADKNIPTEAEALNKENAQAQTPQKAPAPRRKRTTKPKASADTVAPASVASSDTAPADAASADATQAATEEKPASPAPKKPRAPRKKKTPVEKAPEATQAPEAEPIPETAPAPAAEPTADASVPVADATTPAEPAVTVEPTAPAPLTPKKILFVGAEVMPYAATGGLGDVMGSLPAALKAKYGEHADVRVITPLYESIAPEVHAAMKTEAVFTVKLAWRQQYCGILSLCRDGVTYYFVDNEYYFKRGELYGHFDDGERYAYFCKAVLEMMPHIGFFPDILHANDWQAALSVIYLNTEYRRRMGGYEHIRTVFTIHNIEYQGQYSFDILGDVFDISPEHKPLMAYDGCINLMKAAIQCADRVTTVSETYAHEIMTPTYSHRLHYILARCAGKVSGILNGIDTVYYNPAADPDIPVAYSADDPAGKVEDKLAFQRAYALPEDAGAPIIAVVSRLSPHKGIDLIAGGIRHILDTHPRAQFVLLGTGEGNYEAFFRQLENDYHDRARCFIMYNRALSKKIYAAADIFLMPSRSEPCGLSQMIACRYGAIPVVRETGGLYDSIKPFYEDESGLHGNGFTFANYNAAELEERTNAALSLYDTHDKFAELRRHAMTSDFSWDASAGKYMDMYQGM